MSSREISHAPTKEMVFTLAREVFGEARKVHSWMNTPNSVFDGMCPKDFIEYGSTADLERVLDELNRIEQGVF